MPFLSEEEKKGSALVLLSVRKEKKKRAGPSGASSAMHMTYKCMCSRPIFFLTYAVPAKARHSLSLSVLGAWVYCSFFSQKETGKQEQNKKIDSMQNPQKDGRTKKDGASLVKGPSLFFPFLIVHLFAKLETAATESRFFPKKEEKKRAHARERVGLLVALARAGAAAPAERVV